MAMTTTSRQDVNARAGNARAGNARVGKLLRSSAPRAVVTLLVGLLACCVAIPSAYAAKTSSIRFGRSSGRTADTSRLAIVHTSDREDEEAGEAFEEGEGEEAATTEAEEEEAALPSSASDHTPSSPGSSSSGVAAVVSRLELTAQATAALALRQPSASTVGFSFMLSAPARVRVTLVKRTGGPGHEKWLKLPDSLTLNAPGGHVSHSLTGHNKLSPGHYRLTVTPLGGKPRSVYVSAR